MHANLFASCHDVLELDQMRDLELAAAAGQSQEAIDRIEADHLARRDQLVRVAVWGSLATA